MKHLQEQRLPIIADVAERAGVSIGTVSNVLNNPDIVKKATRARVLEAIDALGFVPNGAARSLATGVADTVGFIAVDLANSYFMDIAKGIESSASKSTPPFRSLLANSDVDLAKQSSYLHYFEQSRAGGTILAPLDAPLTEAERIRARGTRLVYVNWPGEDGISCGVTVDEILGGRLSAQHLMDQGCTQLMFVGGPLKLTAVRDRFTGARQAVKEQAGTSLELLETRGLTVPSGVEVGRTIAAMAPHSRPDGIIAAADALASGLVQSLLLAGLRVPHDVAVVGYDDNHFADSATVPLSTIAQPGFAMGQLAMGLLIEEIFQSSAHEHRTLTVPPRLIERRSSQYHERAPV